MRRRKPDPPLISRVHYVEAPDADSRYYKALCVLIPELREDWEAKDQEVEQATPEEE